jgi:hypothetical protein
MLSLEMLGYFRDEPGSQRYPSPIFRMAYPSPGNYVLIVGRPGEGQLARQVKMLMTSGSALPAYSVNAPASLAGVDWSDHYNYWKQGFPALMVTDTALNRNRNYHTEGDTADRLDYHRMSMAVQGVYAAVLGAAAQPLAEGR